MNKIKLIKLIIDSELNREQMNVLAKQIEEFHDYLKPIDDQLKLNLQPMRNNNHFAGFPPGGC